MGKILEHFIEGDISSQDKIVFLQGWPDNASIWDSINWRQQLKKYHLIFINFPNTNANIEYKWGKDFPQIVEDLKQTLNWIGIEDGNVIMVGHDWGCFYGYMFDQKYPQFFKHLIMLDVPAKAQLSTVKESLFVLGYQSILVGAFLVGGPLGNILTQTMSRLFGHKPPYLQKISSSQNYPYYYLYRNLLKSKFLGTEKFLSGYRPSTGITYLYGKNKPFQFQGEKWKKIVEESGGNVYGLQSGHWIMQKYGKLIIDVVRKSMKPKL